MRCEYIGSINISLRLLYLVIYSKTGVCLKKCIHTTGEAEIIPQNEIHLPHRLCCSALCWRLRDRAWVFKSRLRWHCVAGQR